MQKTCAILKNKDNILLYVFDVGKLFYTTIKSDMVVWSSF